MSILYLSRNIRMLYMRMLRERGTYPQMSPTPIGDVEMAIRGETAAYE